MLEIDVDNDTGCPERDNDGDLCGGAIPPGSPVDLCQVHLIRAYLFMQNLLAEAGTPTADPRVLSREDDRTNVVYYVRLGTRVKIGTTRNIEGRLRILPHEEVLAIEPGGYEVEALRHDQFSQLRVRGEWFLAEEKLLSHAAALRERYSQIQFGHAVTSTMKVPRLVTSIQAAQVAGVSEATVRVWAHRGILRPAADSDGVALYRGNRPLYWSSDVRAAATRNS